MDSFFGQPDCQHRMRCAVKSTYRSGQFKRPTHHICSRCPFIPRILELDAQAAAKVSRNIDVILTQPDDSITES